MFLVIVCSWLTFHFYINSDIVILVKWNSCIPAVTSVSKSAAETPLSYVYTWLSCMCIVILGGDKIWGWYFGISLKEFTVLESEITCQKHVRYSLAFLAYAEKLSVISACSSPRVSQQLRPGPALIEPLVKGILLHWVTASYVNGC